MHARRLIVLLSLFVGLGWSAEITRQQAETAVGTWLRREAQPFGTALGGGVGESRTVASAEGVALFHVVRLEGGGYVVTSAEDGIWPVVAFSPDEDLVEDARNPLWELLNQDMALRRAAVEAARQQRPAQAAGVPGPAAEGSPEAEWAGLLDDSGTVTLGLSSLSDVRVAPLLQSQWGQSTVGSANVFNYYTPNNYVCGCVATAGAQIMRYHQYPTASVSAGSYKCWVNGVAQTLTMMGGTYAWASMPLVPTSSSSLTQRQAISKLTYDVGVASYMQYSDGDSGAHSSNLRRALADRFGYASAQVLLSVSGVHGHIERAMLSNFDAGFPVSLGMKGSAGGHEVVGDGYGYSGSTRYIHLNMGWKGSSDAWYNLPTVDSSPSFSILESIVFNVFPTHTGEILSGRVLNAAGTPVSGATVTAVNLTTATTLPSVTSNAKGIYAVRVPRPASADSYRVDVTSGSLVGSASTTVEPSVSTSTTYNPDTASNTYTPGTGAPGGRWGVDVTVRTVVALATALDTAGLTWTTGGDASWQGQTAESHDGTDAAQSGGITHSQQSWMQTSVQGPGTLSFWWRVSSESSFDFLRFSINGVENASISGSPAWAYRTVTLGAGANTLRWAYTKDGSASSGSDCGWVDQVAWTPTLSEHDLDYYTRTGWPSGFFLNSATNGLTAMTSFAQGSPIYLSYAFYNRTDKDISSAITNRFTFVRYGATNTLNGTSNSGLLGGYNNATVAYSWWALQGLTGGVYTITCVLNYDSRVSETNYLNNTRSITFTVTPPAPAAPGSVSATDGTSAAGVTVSWGAVSGATSYGVYRGTAASSAAATLLGIATGTSYVDGSAVPDVRYYYWVKARNGTGDSAFSAYDQGYRAMPTPCVGSAFTLDLQSGGGKVTVAGLPAGLKYNAATRQISGVPTLAGTYRVTVMEQGQAPVYLTLTVAALPVWAQGVFNGYVPGGGSATLTVSATGKAAGALLVGGVKYAFSAPCYAAGGSAEEGFLIEAAAKVGKGTVPVALTVTSAGSPATLGQVAGTVGAMSVRLWRDVWAASGGVLAPYVGYYTATFSGDTAEHGSGYMTFTVDGLGKVKAAGKLADGTALTAGCSLILDEEGRVFWPLYMAPKLYQGGAFFGLVELVVPGGAGRPVLRFLDGEPGLWTSQNPAATSDYGAGFSYTLSVMTGGWYNRVLDLRSLYAGGLEVSGVALPSLWVPVKYILWDETMTKKVTSMGADYAAGQEEASPEGLAIGVTPAYGQGTGLAAPAADVPVVADGGYLYRDTSGDGVNNTSGLTVKFTLATGLFTGSFKTWHHYVSVEDTTTDRQTWSHVAKAVAFQGVLTPTRASGDDEGRGFFLWADKAEYLSSAGKWVTYGYNRSCEFALRAR